MNIPTIRVEVEGMRHAILTHLASHHEEIEKAVASELEAVVKELDIRKIVQEQAPKLIMDCIHSAMKDAMSRIQYDAELRDKFFELMRDGFLRKYPWENGAG